MTQYDRLNVKLSNSQTQTKSAIKNETEVDLRLSSNMVAISMMRLIFLKTYY